MKQDIGILSRLAKEFAAVVQEIDARVEHERWQPGIGPFEEERQLEFLIDGVSDDLSGRITTEVPYPNERKWCDLIVESNGREIPIEAKLIRFRRDNSDIEPTAFNRVFSPFPGRSPSLLSDAKALAESGFPEQGGLLGLYYEWGEEPFDVMEVESIAEKVAIDAGYWFDLNLNVVEIARCSELRHPVFDSGAIVTWKIGP